MKNKFTISVLLFLSILLSVGIVRESIARKPTEIDFYKKYCSKSNDIMCENFIDL